MTAQQELDRNTESIQTITLEIMSDFKALTAEEPVASPDRCDSCDQLLPSEVPGLIHDLRKAIAEQKGEAFKPVTPSNASSYQVRQGIEMWKRLSELGRQTQELRNLADDANLDTSELTKVRLGLGSLAKEIGETVIGTGELGID